MMRLWAAGLASSAALILSGMASGAGAAPVDLASVPDNTPSSTPFTAPIPHKSYAFDNHGRWGFNLDMEQPTNRETEWKDVTAGAYFRINPHLKFGGTVGLGDKFAQPQQITPQDVGPRVHLETKFQF